MPRRMVPITESENENKEIIEENKSQLFIGGFFIWIPVILIVIFFIFGGFGKRCW